MKLASCSLFPALLLLPPLVAGVIHDAGSMGLHLASMSVAIVAVIGPLTHCHIALALESLAYADDHAFRIRGRILSSARCQIPVQAVTCSVGIRTLGSAELAEKRPLLKAHFSTEVAHVPADIRPVALAMFVLALFTLVGAMPTTVWP